MTNTELAQSLRQVADFYEGNPDAPVPSFAGMFIHCWNKVDFLAAAKQLAKGGSVAKTVDGADTNHPEYIVKRDFGVFSIQASIARNLVCRLVRPAEYECPDSLLEEAADYTEVA